MSGGRTGAALAALLLLGGCSGGSASEGDAPPSPTSSSTPDASTPSPGRDTGGTYVALGDSYTAAPFVPTTDLAGGCLRSDGNYPQLLADVLGAEVTDVSCAGATTANLTAPQTVGGGKGTVPPQVRAVRRGTDLVTVGIGGNDGDLFQRLAEACVGKDFSILRRCRPLRAALADATAVVGETSRRVAGALRAVRRAAPRAEVVLVGYPRLVDPARSCVGLPLRAADRALVAGLEQRLDGALARAARSAGARFADLHAASRGHEVCAAHPWVNGGVTDPQAALGFHPFAVEQQAVADAVAALVPAVERGRPVTGATLGPLVERGLVAKDWAEALVPVEGVIARMGEFLRAELAAGRGYQPSGELVLRAFQQPLAEVRVLVVGQDPYPTPGHPIGLSFAVDPGVRPLPQSLRNIYTELVDDLGVPPPTNGDLTPWTRQGVMLLNRVLTVTPRDSGSHRRKGWEEVTERAVRVLAERPGPKAAVLWGKDAQSLAPLLAGVPCVTSAHPSPYSARSGFFGSRPFSRVNALLVDQGGEPVDWRLP